MTRPPDKRRLAVLSDQRAYPFVLGPDGHIRWTNSSAFLRCGVGNGCEPGCCCWSECRCCGHAQLRTDASRNQFVFIVETGSLYCHGEWQIMRQNQLALNSFFEHYPRSFHVSLCLQSSTIESSGLFSAAGLLARSALSLEEREHVLASQRKTTMILHTDFGQTLLNDQIPLPAKALERCLNGISPKDWYIEMNERIFFFLNEDKARGFGKVRADKLPARTLLCLDTKKLISSRREGTQIRLESRCCGAEHQAA